MKRVLAVGRITAPNDANPTFSAVARLVSVEADLGTGKRLACRAAVSDFDARDREAVTYYLDGVFRAIANHQEPQS